MKYDGQLNIAIGRSFHALVWKNKEAIWSKLVKKLTTENKTEETFEEYTKASKEEQTVMKDCGGFVGGELKKNGERKLDNIKNKWLLTLDADFAHLGFWQDFCLSFECAAVLYSTHTHTQESPRYRLVMPLSREVTLGEYEPVARRVAGELGIELFDNTTFELNRLFFWPSSSKNASFYSEVQDGEWLDPDRILDSYADWRDRSQWPVAKGKSLKETHETSKKQADPETKGGIVGTFCRAYNIPQAIETFLPEVYEPAGDDRYTYKKGTGAAGLVIYDSDTFAQSHHDSDPIGSRLCNAFDLVRVHKFGDGDESFKSMEKFCMKDKKVKQANDEEKIENAKSDFADSVKTSQAVITYSIGKLDRVIIKTEATLLEASPYEIFERDGEVVRVVEKKRSAKVRPLDHHYLARILSKYITFVRKTGKVVTIINPPQNLAITYLKSMGTWNLSLLKSLIYVPTIRKDGSILEYPGYDEQSELFLINNMKSLPIPESPTREDALEALKIFDPILVNFKLAPMDRSVFLAAALTSLVRQNFTAAPLFGITAPVKGSGKTLLANVIHLIATGSHVIPMGEGHNNEESDKQIYATLREANPVIVIDNISKGIDSNILCAILTASGGSYKGRPLGKSDMENVNAIVTWLVTGNNIRIKSEMADRVLMCTINLENEKPRARPKSSFEVPRLIEHIMDNRAEIVQALLTMIKAYHIAGHPEQDIPNMGTFEDWSNWIRNPLVWLGEADPYDTIKEIEDNDPERDWQQRLIIYWKELFGYNQIKVSYIMRKCNQAIEDEKNFATEDDKTDNPSYELAQAFTEGISDWTHLNNQTVGILLSKIQNRVIDGYKLIKSKSKSKGSVTWQLIEIQQDDLLL